MRPIAKNVSAATSTHHGRPGGANPNRAATPSGTASAIRAARVSGR
jgi:hypothetical protein